MNYSKADLEKHLAEEHQISPFSTYLKEIVYGGNDGIVTTFAVVAGFTGANANIGSLSYLTVLLFGLANLFADGVSMGLGNFLSMRSERELFHKEKNKELKEINENPKIEKAETQELLMIRGFSKSDAETLVNLYSKNRDYWADFMMRYELEMTNPLENPYLTAVATFLAFVAFGFIPLVPYVFFKNDPQTFIYASIATALALVLLGLLRWRVTRDSIVRSVGEILIVGGLSAVVAFVVGTFFRF
ncbi:hypothetical protein A3A93_00255 [Candidatus Roizmanbacteria bacterium RIFCSPLOWO2_01_FULL_38_12]|uniref:GMP synthase n=1 Tax=Candidatus Roizmanbacteria bacterium RIFCSPLOWO2_01_FULL_38_12 TaxID=1802061 RepID=A0A1F7IUE3_9BACT|nr:MAG: hypothetical protein A2861_00905 [Candidatus Roizmanbacteria bacterium RIFCSPHIGHO2_01_FULL_38_15]OGK34699.1 MAG: hypothetical protein A3F59_01075 [Candidatus Roizmanbacteria bacterium RIFCSPHIGHO2_12_FULL_38_13]OGK46973.1 MAG: hypothetical protein A3A93_00255 [Candidatus Roizmanbacteria bacterium RIFCSPLOWO2_01_FULL_38_12]